MPSRQDLIASGWDDATITRRVRSGDLERVRRGAYRDPTPATPEARHLELLLASLDQTRSAGAVASHISAAVLHGLPIDQKRLTQAHLLREGRVARSCSEGPVWRHSQPEVDATVVNGVPATSLASTVITLARTLPFAEAVAVTDVAVRSIPRAELLRLAERSARIRGVRQARRAIEFADPRSDSPGESRSRALMADLRLPMPDALQHRVVDSEGDMWTDFVWLEQRIVGEFDGAVKYGRLLKPGQSVADVVLREKWREQRLRRQRWWTVRWVWRDLGRPREFAGLITEGLSHWNFSRQVF